MMKKFIAIEGEDHHEREGKMLSKPQRDFDVAQNVAQEPIFYYSRQVNCGGPFKAFWARGESLVPDILCRRSPRDHKSL